jgi:DUF2075 family protein
MTRFEMSQVEFHSIAVRDWAGADVRHSNWPVVYVLDNAPSGRVSTAPVDVYVGESLNAASRMKQHLESPEKTSLKRVRVVLDDTFNKSACLDLESFLIQMFGGDGVFTVLNRNDGITNANYFDRERYRDTFLAVFEELKKQGMFLRSVPEIENTDLFKLSPFKALTSDQGAAVEDILEGLFADLESGVGSTIVVQGEPGTGKTIVAIYLLKLLKDIERATDAEDIDSDSLFSEFFAPEYRALLAGARIGFVVPQQSLRKSIQRVFKKTPGLDPTMVMNAFDVGQAEGQFDLLIVDETHRLNQRANQSSGVRNKDFADITTSLFGSNDLTKTQLDWIRAKSKHQIFLLDAAQSVRPADLPAAVVSELVDAAASQHRFYPLISQMRVNAGDDYVGYVRQMLSPDPTSTPVPRAFEGYDLRMFDSLAEMRDEIRSRDAEVGLARLVAGFAWEWRTKTDKSAFDIELDGLSLRWNGTDTDWIASVGSLEEVGSIHTVQGYDLNYAGVIIGPDLRFDEATDRLVFERKSYFDGKGKENNPTLGKSYTDEDLLAFVCNIYAVLLTRGIRGTYLFVCDPALRRYLSRFIPGGSR